jgi:hypothetical protein
MNVSVMAQYTCSETMNALSYKRIFRSYVIRCGCLNVHVFLFISYVHDWFYISCYPLINGLLWFSLQETVAKNNLVEIESLKLMQENVGVST